MGGPGVGGGGGGGVGGGGEGGGGLVVVAGREGGQPRRFPQCALRSEEQVGNRTAKFEALLLGHFGSILLCDEGVIVDYRDIGDLPKLVIVLVVSKLVTRLYDH